MLFLAMEINIILLYIEEPPSKNGKMEEKLPYVV